MTSLLVRSSRVGRTMLAGVSPAPIQIYTPTFPNLRGISIKVSRTTIYATRTQTSVTGKEQRLVRRRYPRYSYELTFEVLFRDEGDVVAITDFIHEMRGRHGKFVYMDPFDKVARVCRLDSDDVILAQIVDGLWEVSKLEIITVK